MPAEFLGLADLGRFARLDLGLGAEGAHDLVDGRIDLDLAVGALACRPSRSCRRSRCSSCDRETRRRRSPSCAAPRSAGGRSWRRLPGSSWASSPRSIAVCAFLVQDHRVAGERGHLDRVALRGSRAGCAARPCSCPARTCRFPWARSTRWAGSGLVMTKALAIGPRFSSSLSLGSMASLTCFWMLRIAASDWLVALPGSTASDLGSAYFSFLSTFCASGSSTVG